MPRTERFSQYIQRVAYESLVQPDERDERRPDDVPTPAAVSSRHYSAWNATSFSAFVPFSEPTHT
jgi:hypothetical protein